MIFSNEGGEGEIRTREPLSRLTVFKTVPFNHSGTSPLKLIKLASKKGYSTNGPKMAFTTSLFCDKINIQERSLTVNYGER